MRRGAVLAIGLVAVLILSALVAIPTAVRAAPDHPTPSAVRPAATDSIFPTDFYGGYTDTFYTEAHDNDANVFFDASDSTDGNVTVAINDYNASRDGLTNPVAHLTARIVGGVNDSYLSDTYLSIPLSVVYPGTWNLTIDGTNAGFAFYNFSVETFYLDTFSNQSLALPGHSVTTGYWAVTDLNDTFFTHLAKVTVKGMYYNNATIPQWIGLPGTPATLGTGSSGTFTFTVPANASTSGYVQLEFTANTTGWSETGYTYVYVAYLLAPIVTLSACAGACYSTTYDSGATVVATATEVMESGYDGSRAAVPAIDLRILYEAGGTVITPTGTPPTSLTTNANGNVQWLFTATAPFSTAKLNTVSVRPTDPVLASNECPYGNVTFTVLKTTTSAPGIEVTFGSAQYYGGDTVFVNWTLTGNSTVTTGWAGTLWYGYQYGETDYSTETFLPGANISGTAGEVTMVAPLGFTGYLELYFYASNATDYTSGYGYIYITPPQIILTSNELAYQAGNTVTVSVTTLGSALSSATLVALVTDSNGDVLVHGPVTGSTLSVTIPSTAPPDYVEWTVFAVAADGATVTNATLYTDLEDGYSLLVGVGTKSSYTDGSYQPGNTIQITYTIGALGYATMPKAWTIEIWPQNSWDNTGGNVEDFETTATSGSVSYTIPSNAPNGIQAFFVEAIPSGGDDYEVESNFAVDVQSNPSSLGLELGAGSGLTVGWVILLVVIVVVAIVLFLAIRGATRPKVMRPDSGSPPSSSPPPQAWQESSTGPTPPEGAASPPPSGGPTPPPGSS